MSESLNRYVGCAQRAVSEFKVQGHAKFTERTHCSVAFYTAAWKQMETRGTRPSKAPQPPRLRMKKTTKRSHALSARGERGKGDGEKGSDGAWGRAIFTKRTHRSARSSNFQVQRFKAFPKMRNEPIGEIRRPKRPKSESLNRCRTADSIFTKRSQC
jgi:hypothetical protein